MSWDVLILAGDAKHAASQEKLAPLGDASLVRSNISKSLPGVDWKNPAWGLLRTNDCSIEFSQNAQGPVDSIMLHIRGDGDAMAAIVNVCKDNGWVAYDAGSEEMIDLNKPSSKAWEQFRSYRDNVVGQSTPPTASRATNEHPFINAMIGTFLIVALFYAISRKR